MSVVSLSAVGRVLHTLLFLIALAASTAWIATALSVHMSGLSRVAALGALGLSAITASVALWISKTRGWAILLTVLAVSIGWYQTLQPRQDRNWAFDVAHGVQARVDGEFAHLTQVRNFEWTSPDTANVSWEARTYDLEKLTSADLVTSVWDNPDVAHVIVTFGFSDGQRVAFSVETRREAHESYSVVGGFFRQFELVLIAATEEDVLKLRTNHRQEDVRLYPLALNTQQLRDLFLSYVDLANHLQDQPEFYNTLTHNCTTTLYPLAQVVQPDLPLDWRILMSGHLASYVDELGGLAGGQKQAQITTMAQAATRSNYSAMIRRAETRH
ncbi:MAG: DUF4105 domain-containing protein [Pseudomonadota bacterium]